MLGDEPDEPCSSGSYKVTLASLDIKDAFLQVPHDKIIGAEHYDTERGSCVTFQVSALAQKLGTGTSGTTSLRF